MTMIGSVGDADNFRLYHTPGIGWRWPLKFRRIPVGRGARAWMLVFGTCRAEQMSAVADLKDQTIHIRMAGVDAPEVRALSTFARGSSEPRPRSHRPVISVDHRSPLRSRVWHG